MDHLRDHPRVSALPRHPPHRLRHVEADLRSFRQDSWQWDRLHHGRCTTSQAAAALGFLEPTVGEQLGIPLSWRRGGRGAFVRLKQPALRTLSQMNRVLCGVETKEEEEEDQLEAGDQVLWHPTTTYPPALPQRSSTTFWDVTNDKNDDTDGGWFDAQYTYHIPPAVMAQRKQEARQFFAANGNAGTALKMAWGHTQEATAILTALNYFAKQDAGVVIQEVGMCGAGLALNQSAAAAAASYAHAVTPGDQTKPEEVSSSSLLIGASPDAVICYSNGTIEALEVKNHCPFVTPYPKKGKSRNNNNNNKKKHRFILGDRPFEETGKHGGVFPHYVPQMQMEMLCLGPECRSAVMVRQTATKGALLLRMNRDDAWIAEMLHFLHRFQREFVERNVPPPNNFFWEGGTNDKPEIARYRRFVNRTMELRNQVKTIAFVPPEHIQRVAQEAPLFLD